MRILKKERIDLVTLDLKLPDRQEWTCCRTSTGAEDVEVIIITGMGASNPRRTGYGTAPAVYLLKTVQRGGTPSR